MPEGSVDLSTQIFCWKARIHVFVIIAVHIVAALLIAATAIIEYNIAASKNTEEAKEDGSDKAEVKSKIQNAFGIMVLIVLLIPAIAQCLQGAVVSMMLCCKSKCCFGYCSIVTLLAVGFTAYSTFAAFSGTPAFSLGVTLLTGNSFKISFILIGVIGIVALVNQLYCTFVLCKLSYFDRSDGGDLYHVEDGKNTSKEG